MRAFGSLRMAVICAAIACVLLVFGSFVGYAENPNPTAGAPTGQCTVTGQVLKPGPQPINAGEMLTLTAAIQRAGGFNPWADQRKVRLTRRNKDGELEMLTFNPRTLKSSDDPILRDGDRIFVPKFSSHM
jgi:protein involved in polysaccharide export with SLBB domain